MALIPGDIPRPQRCIRSPRRRGEDPPGPPSGAGQEGTVMAHFTRRSVLRGSLGVAAAGVLARPYIANAAATTVNVWWTQGLAHEEDIAFQKIVADYQKASGNTIDYAIFPSPPLRQRIVAAMTSGVVPDVFQNNPGEIIALYAWNDMLVDLSDVVETQREEYTRPRCSRSAATTMSRRNAAFTVYPIRSMCLPTMSGGRWSRRPAPKWRTSRRIGMPSTISSRACRTICASRACATSMALGSR